MENKRNDVVGLLNDYYEPSPSSCFNPKDTNQIEKSLKFSA